MAENPSSPLPQEPVYWEKLALRIREDAVAPLAAYAAVPEAWYGVLARGAPWLVAASAAAMLLLWLVLPASDPGAVAGWIERSVEPDEIAGALIAGPVAPNVETLMVQFPPPLESERPR